MRRVQLPLLAALLLMPIEASAQSPVTTRIETRPFYGATVTLEAGVRVFRALPSHDRIIINPHGATPLNLSYEQSRHVSHNYVYGHDSGGAASAGSADYVVPWHGRAGVGHGKRVKAHHRSGSFVGGHRGHGGKH